MSLTSPLLNTNPLQQRMCHGSIEQHSNIIIIITPFVCIMLIHLFYAPPHCSYIISQPCYIIPS